MTSAPRLRLEPTKPNEYFAAELSAIEMISPCVRLIFSVPRQYGSDAYRDPIVSVILPQSAVALMVRMLEQKPREIRKGEPEADFEAAEFRPINGKSIYHVAPPRVGGSSLSRHGRSGRTAFRRAGR